VWGRSVAEASHAVFLSYASQDAEAAQKIAGALRAGGIEVWFDQSALRGGDVWDQTIRKQIKSCVLFIPVISKHTHERDEGYFRLEWKLAVDRSHLMTADKAFLLPVVIDDTREDDERVPDRFRDVHWTRLPGGETPPVFVERVRSLVSPEPSREAATLTVSSAAPASTVAPKLAERVPASWRSKRALPVMVGVVASGVLAYFAIYKFAGSKHPASPLTPPAVLANAAPAAFAPPPHSVAVLPFVNMSGDKEQEYFSDGLTEEILNSLARINELQVSARTSSFYFKGEHADLATIAHKLNVASVLEGSVRRSGNTIRVTAQLNNAVTGFHLWSQSYDRDLSNVLAMQTEIANAVASALKVTLLGDVAAKIEVAGTRNPGAFDAYLRASKAYSEYETDKDLQAAIAEYAEAIRQDPDFALAYANRSDALAALARNFAEGAAVREYLAKAQADARKAISLAPDLAEGHRALAEFFLESLEFKPATQEYERALALEPSNAGVLEGYGEFAVLMGKTEAGLAAARRAVVLDPLNFASHFILGRSLIGARRYAGSIVSFGDAKALAPNDKWVNQINGMLGLTYFSSGDFENARAACEAVTIADDFNKLICLVTTYEKLGRHADAETAFNRFTRVARRDDDAVFYCMIYAQWGQTTRALDSLETAMRHRSPYLQLIKVSAQFDPIRMQPRFQAVMRELKFPQ
jgi:TolB-like protein/Tfp pilus assembly protein PilF